MFISQMRQRILCDDIKSLSESLFPHKSFDYKYNNNPFHETLAKTWIALGCNHVCLSGLEVRVYRNRGISWYMCRACAVLISLSLSPPIHRLQMTCGRAQQTTRTFATIKVLK